MGVARNETTDTSAELACSCSDGKEPLASGQIKKYVWGVKKGLKEPRHGRLRVRARSPLPMVHAEKELSGTFLDPRRNENPDRQDHNFQPLKLKPLLQGEGGLVVQQAGKKILLLKN